MHDRSCLENITDLTYYQDIFSDKCLDGLKKCLPHTNVLIKSNIFRQLVEKRHRRACTEHLDVKIELLSMIENIWIRAFDDWISFGNSVREGEITIKLVLKRFAPWRDDTAALREQLEYLNDSNDETWINERVEQMKCVFKMESYQSAAEAVLQLKEYYDLQGDFSCAEHVLHQTSNSQVALQDFDVTRMNQFKQLQVLSQDKQKLEVLKEFAQSKEFVQWLRDHLNAEHLKNFFDIAMMFLADCGDVEIKRLQCFYQAVTDYEPLIYQLSDKSGLEDLLTLCEVLWRRLESHQLENVYTNLKEIKTNVGWINMIYENQGSIEKSSIKKIEEINTAGVFHIGNFQNDDYGLSLDKTMSLTIFEGSPDEVNMNFDDVKDLQSKIMLIAGHSTQTDENEKLFNRFTAIFNEISRLMKVYYRLCCSGNLLFTEMFVTVYCSSENKLPIAVSFTLANRILRTASDNVVHDLKGLVKVLESCLSDWQTLIKEKRNCYFQLNYFSCQQLAFLQKELCCLFNDNDRLPDNRVYPLLETFRKNLCYNTLKENAILMLQRQNIERERKKLLAESSSDVMDADVESEIRSVLVNDGFGTDVINIVIGRLNSKSSSPLVINDEFKELVIDMAEEY